MQEFLLSDAGWMVLVAVGFIFLTIVMWSFLSGRGTRVAETSGTAVTWAQRTRYRFRKSPNVVIALVGIVFVAMSIAMLSFYYQVVNGPPYISSETGNVVIISVIAILIVSIFSLGMALLKNFGALSVWAKIIKGDRK